MGVLWSACPHYTLWIQVFGLEISSKFAQTVCSDASRKFHIFDREFSIKNALKYCLLNKWHKLVDLVNENTKESKPTAGFQRIVQRAALHSQANGQKSINGADVLAEFFFENDSYALTCLKQAHLKRNDILNYNKKINNPGSINEQDILKKQVFPKTKDNSLAISHRLKSQINLEESAPHNAAPSKSPEIELEKYCINLNAKATEDDIDCLIGRQTEIQRTIEILCRRKKNNALLVGESGVGKTAIAEGLAIRIVKGDVPDILKDAVIYSLDIGSLVAGTKFRGDFEERIKLMLEALRKLKNAILFIDEIHSIIGAGFYHRRRPWC